LTDKNLNPRKFPVLLLIMAGFISSAVSAYGGTSAVTLGLGYLMFTMSFFLILIAVFNKIKIYITRQIGIEESNTKRNKIEESKIDETSSRFLSTIKIFFNKTWGHISSFYLEEKTSLKSEEPDSAETTEPTMRAAMGNDSPEKIKSGIKSPENDLVEIQKPDTTDSSDDQEHQATQKPKLETLYIITFLVIAAWRLIRMFTIMPLLNVEFYVNILDALLLLIFPCVAITYLKMRKNEGTYPGDKTSHHLLTLLSYVSLVYSAVIAANLMLNINILVVLRWLFYAVMIYLISAFGINILFSILKNKIFDDFNYILIPNL